MKRVYLVDVLVCECGGKRKVLNFTTDYRVIRKILEHLAITAEPPAIAAARPPPQPTLPFA